MPTMGSVKASRVVVAMMPMRITMVVEVMISLARAIAAEMIIKMAAVKTPVLPVASVLLIANPKPGKSVTK